MRGRRADDVPGISNLSDDSVPGTGVFEYDALADRLSLGFCDKDGSKGSFVVKEFLAKRKYRIVLDGEDNGFFEKTVKRILEKPSSGAFSVRLIRPRKSSSGLCRVQYAGLPDGCGAVLRVLGQITDLNVYRERLEEASMLDSMTKLLNHASSLAAIGDAIAKGAQGTLFMMDVDNFKQVNDTFGHPKGDDILRSIADVMNNVFRVQDVRGRYGGDEFIFFMNGVTSRQTLDDRINAFRDAIHEIKLPDGRCITVSIGGVRVSSDVKLRSLVEKADKALYAAKAAGRDRCMFYEDIVEKPLGKSSVRAHNAPGSVSDACAQLIPVMTAISRYARDAQHMGPEEMKRRLHSIDKAALRVIAQMKKWS